MAGTTIRRAFAELGDGQVHYAQCGPDDAEVVLLLHQTPRSWAEYRSVPSSAALSGDRDGRRLRRRRGRHDPPASNAGPRSRSTRSTRCAWRVRVVGTTPAA